ncbi:DUF995 domain-containing protein [Mesorhizobium sp. M9A.F.Ca.ET.002.03.1.2]|uniref:DUF995 domain-containing protein n=1 Tax=Mesorhizobium sp. M9A.F.Ca.ET.002.03.1.2 TaxID=2493668 RepID=UPI000F75F84E|nr:DUF995 domain-containing protein [Mesorhizobium sp. M9A.F.Ca.ET.002.03.1.2]AZN98272.1 DUF995 domain-containing protein [Mesorhizobium sp. M9A.F.Ca.ET.002.03.1.2]
MRKLQILLALAAIGGCMSMASFDAAAATQSKTSIAAESGTPLTTEELFRLYSNRSWIWKNGAGYFSAKQRRFIAATGRGSAGSLGVGRWFLTDSGKLCFWAEWYAKSGVSPALTCFRHRKKGGVVFQRKEPDGEWYAFKNAPTRANDEYRKLRAGDYVSAKYNRIQAKLPINR